MLTPHAHRHTRHTIVMECWNAFNTNLVCLQQDNSGGPGMVVVLTIVLP